MNPYANNPIRLIEKEMDQLIADGRWTEEAFLRLLGEAQKQMEFPDRGEELEFILMEAKADWRKRLRESSKLAKATA